jgi:hypothetical protein
MNRCKIDFELVVFTGMLVVAAGLFIASLFK